ncbi:MAG: hypothetical protein P4L22_01315 [Candidatus Babeliales bacterium]|nr:hypothetical protein [Candidatus Babeliales bacterium]
MKNIFIITLLFTGALIASSPEDNILINQLFTDETFNSKFADFPVNVADGDSEKQIYQVDVLSQFNPDGTCENNVVYGSTCGRHAFKNALFGLLLLQAYENKNELDFENYAKNLNELTENASCILKEVNNESIAHREMNIAEIMNEDVIEGDEEQTLSAEEVQYLIGKMPKISAKCGVPFAGLQITTAPFFPGINFKDLLKGDTWGKPIINAIENIRTNLDYNTAFIVAVPGHWITLIVYKKAGVLKFIPFDSANNSHRLNDPNINQLISLITDPDSFDVAKIKQKFDFEEVNDKLFLYSIEYRKLLKSHDDSKDHLEKALILLDIADLEKKVLALNYKIKNQDGFNAFADRKSLANLLPLLPPEFQAEVAKDEVAYNKIKAARFLLANSKNINLQESKLNLQTKRLKLFIENKDPLERSYEGLIKKYNQLVENNPQLARKFLEYLNKIAYTKEGYAHKYKFIKEYLESMGFSQKEMIQKLAPINRNLKLFIEHEDALEYSYEGLIKKYHDETDLETAKNILIELNEIAYTKEGYANKYDFIKKYLDKEGFSAKEIYELLENKK